MTADPARAERLGKRQLEQSVCWTSGERLRCLWLYRFRLTWQEINYASRGMVELQMRLPGQSSANSPERRQQNRAEIPPTRAEP